LPDEQDRLIVAMLNGGERSDYAYYAGNREASKYRLTEALSRVVVPLMARTGGASCGGRRGRPISSRRCGGGRISPGGRWWRCGTTRGRNSS